MYDSSDLRKGLKIEIDGDPYVVVQFEFVKPGKGQALYKCRLKNMITGSQFDKTYRSGEKFKEANLEEVEMEYLYFDGNTYCFMNSSNYEQEFLTEEQVGDARAFLKENTVCNVLMFEKKALDISLPNFVETGHLRGGTLGQRRYRRRVDQAGHPRNRSRGSGAAICQPGGKDPHRYADGAICGAGKVASAQKGHLSAQAGVLALVKPSTVRCYACGFKIAAALA